MSYCRKRSGSYSRRILNKRERYLKKCEKLRIPPERPSRRDCWKDYQSYIQQAAESLEMARLSKTDFTDKLSVQQKYLMMNIEGEALTLPFDMVINKLPEPLYQYMRSLPHCEEETDEKESNDGFNKALIKCLESHPNYSHPYFWNNGNLEVKKIEKHIEVSQSKNGIAIRTATRKRGLFWDELKHYLASEQEACAAS